MNILYHHRTRSQDGQRIHIDGLVGALRRAGHEVRVVGPELAAAAGSTGAAPRPGWRRMFREVAEILYNILEWRQLRQAARDFAAQAVYSRHALFTCAAGSFARRRKLPWIVEVNAPLAWERARHGGLTLQRLARWLETRTLNRADRVIVVTQVMGDMLVEQGVQRGRLEVHPNGIDPERHQLAPNGRDPRQEWGCQGLLVLGFVGYVRDWNRLERTYDFLASSPQSVLVIVGEGPDQPRLQQLAKERGIAAQVRFLGSLDAAEVMPCVAAFDIAVLPEVTHYASPLKVLDYMAAGRAILAPDRPNIREVLEHERNALLFDPEEDTDFTVQLQALAASAERRQRYGEAARATLAERELTWDHNARRVTEFLQEQTV